MPVPVKKRTADKILREITAVTNERDKQMAEYRKSLKVLDAEYSEAVAREIAERKLAAMSDGEKAQMAEMLGVN